jgi:hypothetical protein
MLLSNDRIERAGVASRIAFRSLMRAISLRMLEALALSSRFLPQVHMPEAAYAKHWGHDAWELSPNLYLHATHRCRHGFPRLDWGTAPGG